MALSNGYLLVVKKTQYFLQLLEPKSPGPKTPENQ